MSGLIRKWIDGEGWQTVVDDGAGGNFNGGTITEPLAITLDPGDTNPALNITGGAGGSAAIMYAYDGNGNLGLTYSTGTGFLLTGRDDGSPIFQVGPTGAVTISPSEDVVGLTLTPASDQTSSNLLVNDTDGDGSLNIDANGSLTVGGSPLATRPSLTVGGGAGQTTPPLEIYDTDFENLVLSVSTTGAVTISPSDPAVVPLTIQADPDQSESLLLVKDGNGDTRVSLTSNGGGFLLSNGDGSKQISMDTDAGTFALGGDAGTAVSLNSTSGVHISPTDPGSDCLFLDGGDLVAADGACMIRLVDPIGDMPDGSYSNNSGTINMDATPGAPKLLLRFKDSNGDMFEAAIPLTAA